MVGWIRQGQDSRIAMQIFEKFFKAIRDHHMLQRGGRVLVGVSGGADSVALLHLLLRIRNRYDLELIVGHFNHKLRGEESDGDEEFVRGLANRYQLTCLTECVSSTERWTSQSGNVESWARDRRYEFFSRMSGSHQTSRIALGHTMDDQAETVLMRLVRGSGTLGLAAIPHVREGLFIRPLIRIKREEILGFLTQHHIEYREDSSNKEDKFLRNKIRRELIPLKSKYNRELLRSCRVRLISFEKMQRRSTIWRRKHWKGSSNTETELSGTWIGSKDFPEACRGMSRRSL
jgi:tRNA(Ile)-lysidine synthase